MVENGELPPLLERLPKNPRVLPVYEQIGQYGGTWNRAYTGLSDRWGVTKIIEEHIVEFYLPNGNNIDLELNWADEMIVSPDAKEYQFHIREGLKWSDGIEVTTEDVRFWYEDVFLNKLLVPTFPEQLTVNGKPLSITIIDKYTFIVKFDAPYPFFPEIMAKLSTLDVGITLHGTSFIMPFHYLKDYHPDYTSAEDLRLKAERYNIDEWRDLWGYNKPITSWWLNPDLPVITAWTITVPPPADKIIMERNPYYFAVDPAGNQLPYIDKVVHTLIKESEDLSLMAVQGQLDMQDRHIQRDDYTFLKNSESLGDYKVKLWIESGPAIFLNFNTEDYFLSKLFNDSEFRHALSISLNRQEIRELVFNGLGKISQAGPMSASPYYDPELAEKWIGYDLEKANYILDKMGLIKDVETGYRTDSEGDTIEIVINYPREFFGELISTLIQGYWQDIGIKTKWELIERKTYIERVNNNTFEAGLYFYSRNLVIPADPSYFLGLVEDGTWMPRWLLWHNSKGKEGVEPPSNHPIHLAWDLWEKAKSASTRTEAETLVQNIITLHKENIWVIGILGELPVPVIVKNNIHNIPDFGSVVDDLRGTGSVQPAQFYISSIKDNQ